MIGIYKITNTINNKCYIGQSIDIEYRWKQHIRNGKHLYEKTKISLALNKYGANAFKFEVLEECPLDQIFLDEREQYWIEYYDSYNNGYNSTLGGQLEKSWTYNPQEIRDLWDEGYSIGEIAKTVGCSVETVRKHLKGYNDYNVHTGCSRGALRSIVGKSAPISVSSAVIYQYDLNGQYVAEYKSIIEAARALGHDNSGSLFGVLNHAQQTAYGFQWSTEKVESMPVISTHGGKLVKCINTNQIFHSTGEAAKWCNLKSSSSIVGCCGGRQKTAGKHPETGERLKWEYIES